jgi:hypothetical protein
LPAAELSPHRRDNLRFEIIESVCAELGGETAAVLSELSHRVPAWHYVQIRGKLSPELVAYGHMEDPDGL